MNNRFVTKVLLDDTIVTSLLNLRNPNWKLFGFSHEPFF